MNGCKLYCVFSSEKQLSFALSALDAALTERGIRRNGENLENAFDDGAVIDAAALIGKGLVKKELDGIKILAHGDLTKKFTVKAHAFSKEAKAKIEACGGTAEVVE